MSDTHDYDDDQSGKGGFRDAAFDDPDTLDDGDDLDDFGDEKDEKDEDEDEE